MVICNNCGVELEPDMEICPLCETPVNLKTPAKKGKAELKKDGFKKVSHFESRDMSRPQRKAVWEGTGFHYSYPVNRGHEPHQLHHQ